MKPQTTKEQWKVTRLGGISMSEYSSIHYWLRQNFGKASKCENADCSGKSKEFQWALKRDCKYERNRDNFMELCRSCHVRYDFTENTRKKLQLANIGKKYSEEQRRKRSLFNIGAKHPWSEDTKINFQARYPKGEKSHKAKLTTKQVREIKRLYSKGGVLLKHLGQKYGVHYVTISDIIEGRTWKNI